MLDCACDIKLIFPRERVFRFESIYLLKAFLSERLFR